MATRSRRSSPPPISRNQLIAPGALLLAALVVAILGYLGVATGILLGSVGAWLVVIGRHRRWKGAPEAGYLLAGVGLLIILLALFS